MVKPGYSIARWNNLEDHTIFTNTFTVVGTSAIEHGLHDGNDCLIMDEIGRFEKDNEIFLNMVWEALIQKKVPVLVVLKKEKLPFNKKVWGMEKGIHVDMDLMDSEEAFKLSVRYFMEKMETL